MMKRPNDSSRVRARLGRCRFVITAAAPVALTLALSSGAAFAYLKATGSGNGSANAGSLSAVTATSSATPTSSLLPGLSGDVAFTVNNPNSFSVSLVSVTGNGSITASPPACTTSNGNPVVTFAVPTSDLPITLLPGTSTVHLASAASMDAAATSNCQGASFSIPVSITVQK